ncbi:39S ribosomal protein L22, mitochondrial [Spiromyces aspiralis]|uniref:39S ribosomal protein L22, mitochondrial n=1 Tax=Spiromyces aspiralis TaxID=68401 RepID=A0ACC1HKL0_9FUNG|nr:39S ribosomal protein L22, mitochondrial [Spiromyces aspiralis]
MILNLTTCIFRSSARQVTVAVTAAAKAGRNGGGALGVMSVLRESFHTSAIGYKKKNPIEEGRVIQPQMGASSLFEQALSDAKRQQGATTAAAGQEQHQQPTAATGSILEQLPPAAALAAEREAKEYRYSTTNFRTSTRKLRFLAKQIVGLSINEAVEQMQFSAKKAAQKIKSTLAFARKNAIYQKQMNPELMYVAEAWVGKGRYHKRLDIKARGRIGVKHRPSAHMKFVLKERTTEPEDTLVAGIRDRGKRRKIRGFGDKRKSVWMPLQENKPIYNPKPYYNW